MLFQNVFFKWKSSWLLALKEEKIAGLLESPKPLLDNPLLDIPLSNEGDIPVSYAREAEYFKQFLQIIRALWAYTYFIIQGQYYNKIDLDLWTKAVHQANQMV